MSRPILSTAREGLSDHRETIAIPLRVRVADRYRRAGAHWRFQADLAASGVRLVRTRRSSRRRSQRRMAASSNMSRRRSPISWWLRISPSRVYPARSAVRTDPMFHGSICSSTRYRPGSVQANAVNAVNASAA